MLVGPIFSAELVTSARRTRYYLWRVLYSGLLLTVLIIVYLASFGFTGADSISAAADYAQGFFHSYAIIQLLAVLLLGPAMAAGSIARERERRTIEYLFTTHLTSAEIVLNKLTAAVVQIGAGVLVGVPVLALAMLLGGIAPSVLLAVSLITLSTIAAVVALGLVNSVTSRRARDAVARTYVLLFVLLFGPMLLQSLLRGVGTPMWFDDLMNAIRAIQPLAVLDAVLSPPSASPGAAAPVDRWSLVRTMLLVHGTLAILAVAFCGLALRRMKLEASVATGDAERGRRRFRRALGEHAMVWKELFAGRSYSQAAVWARRGQWLVVFAAVIGSLWQFVDANLRGNPQSFLVFAQWMGLLLELVALLLAAAWASNSIASERERETWTMLVSTPLTAKEIVAGKVAGSVYAARMLLVPLGVLWILAAINEPRFMPSIPFTAGSLAVLSVTSSLVGVLYSLWCSNGTRALAATLGTGLGAVVAGTCCCLLYMINPIYLLGFPGVACMFAIEEKMGGRELAAVFGIYGSMWAVGMACQLGIIGGLWAICLNRFDRLAGRFHFVGPTWASPDAKVVGQFVPPTVTPQ